MNTIDLTKLAIVPSFTRSLKFAGLAGAILIPASLLAGSVTVNWDDFTGGPFSSTSLGYGGLNWYYGDGSFGSLGSNDGNHGLLQYSPAADEGDTAYSSPNAAYNAWGNTPMRIESLSPTAASAFTLSGYFSGQPDLTYLGGTAATEIQVEGFSVIGTSSTAVFTTTFTLPSNGSWVNEDFSSYGAVNKLLFSPLDASGDPSEYLAGYFWMDDVTINTVPDAGGWLVTIMAGCAVFGMIRLREALR